MSNNNKTRLMSGSLVVSPISNDHVASLPSDGINLYFNDGKLKFKAAAVRTSSFQLFPHKYCAVRALVYIYI